MTIQSGDILLEWISYEGASFCAKKWSATLHWNGSNIDVPEPSRGTGGREHIRSVRILLRSSLPPRQARRSQSPTSESNMGSHPANASPYFS
jgi:hypothetical protein